MTRPNLIGISGKIGSGKDTVGTIIQYLVSQQRMNSNEPLRLETHINYSATSGWFIEKFAGKLKQVASIMTGIHEQDFEYPAVKESNLGPRWGNITVREFLQRLGTNAVRDNVHENAWVNALFANYRPMDKGKAHLMEDFSELYTHTSCQSCQKAYMGYKRQYLCKECIEDESVQFYPNWIITDVRFPNEAKAVEEHGGILIRVERPLEIITAAKARERLRADLPVHCIDHLNNERFVVEPDDVNVFKRSTVQFAAPRLLTPHSSETALDQYPFQHTIMNDGSIEDLILSVKDLLIKENILCQQKSRQAS